MNSRNWLIEWFVNHYHVLSEELEENADANYFNQGYLDSFQFIQLIADIEETFGIEFDNTQFENREFSTFNGLAKAINKNREAGY